MTTTRDRFRSALSAKAQSLNRRLKPDEVLDTCEAVAGELEAEWTKRRKERQKAGIDMRARDILNVYPRREGGDAALVSISKAIDHDGFEVVLEKTTEYASAVARWPHNRKRSASGNSLIPLPTTFFNNRRYLDDSAQWWEGTGGKPKKDAPECLPEPSGWRFCFPETRQVRDNEPWERIDLITQRYIIEHMPQKANIA